MREQRNLLCSEITLFFEYFGKAVTSYNCFCSPENICLLRPIRCFSAPESSLSQRALRPRRYSHRHWRGSRHTLASGLRRGCSSAQEALGDRLCRPFLTSFKSLLTSHLLSEALFHVLPPLLLPTPLSVIYLLVTQDLSTIYTGSADFLCCLPCLLLLECPTRVGISVIFTDLS